jgi:C-terminal processing protease CtpA/Prc
VQCPQVTTLGDRTAGSSAAPKLVDVGSGISVKVPQWNDCDAAGAPYEDRGVPVKIALTNAAEAFTLERDPVLEAALERLRASPKNKRAPGKR